MVEAEASRSIHQSSYLNRTLGAGQVRRAENQDFHRVHRELQRAQEWMNLRQQCDRSVPPQVGVLRHTWPVGHRRQLVRTKAIKLPWADRKMHC